MAENKNEDKKENETKTVTSGPTENVTPSDTTTPTPDDKAWFVPDKFKTPEDMKQSYDSLENKLTEVGTEVGQLKQLLSTAYQNNQSPPTPQEDKGNDHTVDPRIDEMENAMRFNTITEFDKRFGIKEDEQMEIHKRVGQELQALGHDIRTAQVNMLPSLLDRAYKLAYPDRNAESARQEGAAATMSSLQSALPSQGGGSISEAETGKPLTGEQKEWMKKLGQDDKRAAELKKKYEGFEE